MSIFGDIGGLVGGLFGGGGNPADAASPYLQQIPGYVHQYMDPYIKGGLKDYGTLQQQFGQLVSDPHAMYNKLAAGYQQSPGYQYQVDQATQAANRAAAAGGQLGSGAEQTALAQRVSGIANQDFGDYMNRMQGLYGQGLQGLSGLNQMGFQASGMAMDDLTRALMNQANLAYAGQANQNQRAGGIGGAIGSLIGDLF
jgi:hypothetical protein